MKKYELQLRRTNAYDFVALVIDGEWRSFWIENNDFDIHADFEKAKQDPSSLADWDDQQGWNDGLTMSEHNLDEQGELVDSVEYNG